jgi:hypothetical protein
MSRTLERARSMMVPANPVPPNAFGDSWNYPSGHATFGQIVALPSDGEGSGTPRRRSPAGYLASGVERPVR